MNAAEQGIDREECEALTLSAIDNLELVALGETPAAVVAAGGALDAVRGLMLYAQLLETSIVVMRGTDVPEIRAAARTTSRAWRTRVGS